MSTFPDDLASIQINPSITDILIQGRRSAAKLLTKDEARGIAAHCEAAGAVAAKLAAAKLS